jgi:DNA-binding NtrC family response regulator
MKTLTSRILSIDQDREFLQLFRNSLPPESYTETVDSVPQALQKLRTDDFAVVAVDLNLLEAPGQNFFDWIRTNQPLTVCVVLTTLPADIAASAAARVSAFDFLLKPASSQQLAYTLQRALDYRKLLLSEREARVRLQNLNEQHNQFLATMMHEMRTPLTAVMGAIHILRSLTMTETQTQSIFGILERNVSTIKLQLDDLLAHSQSDHAAETPRSTAA